MLTNLAAMFLIVYMVFGIISIFIHLVICVLDFMLTALRTPHEMVIGTPQNNMTVVSWTIRSLLLWPHFWYCWMKGKTMFQQ